MSPIFRLFIPMIIGMIGANLFYAVFAPHTLKLLVLLSLAFVGMLTFQIKKHDGNNGQWILHASYLSFFFLFGIILQIHSINRAKEKYGDNWRTSVYRDNPLQLQSAKHTQQAIGNWYNEHGITGQEGAIIQAMTIGDKKNLSRDTKDAFANAGVSHILTLSGFHVGFIYMILQILFLTRFYTRKAKRLAQTILILILWAYAFISGMSPSMVRATTMCTIISLGHLHTNKILSLNVLFLSATIQTLINPLIITHVGFQLSYMSMFAIYFLGLPIYKKLRPYCAIDRFIISLLCITISCSIFTMPILSYTFGTIPLLSVPANLIISILAYLIFLLMPFFFISSGSQCITEPLMLLSNMMIKNASYISNLPYSTFHISFTLPAVILYYSILGIVIICVRRLTTIRRLHINSH